MVTCFILAFTLLFPLGVAADQRIAFLTPDSMYGDNLDYTELYIFIQGDQWDTANLSPDYFTLNNAPEGLSVTDAVYRGIGGANLILGYTGPEIEEDIEEFSVTISGAALASGSDLTTNSIKIYAVEVFPFTFEVHTTEDTMDVNPGDGICADALGDCSLRAAIEEANALPGEQSIYVPGGTYHLSSAQLEIADNLRIVGSGMEETVINSTSWFRVFKITNDVSVRLSDLKITGGMAGGGGSYEDGFGGGIYNEGNLELDSVWIEDNAAYYLGGGIYSEGPLTIQNSKITNNGEYEYNPGDYQTVRDGGGIYHTGPNGLLMIKDTEISGNMAENAGGLFVSKADAIIQDVSIEQNIADVRGGGLTVESAYFIMTDSQIKGNVTKETSEYIIGGAGGLYITGSSDGDSIVEISYSKFIGNTTAGRGGAIMVNNSNKGAHTFIRYSEFIENHAAENGGLLAFDQFVNNYAIIMNHNFIEDNTAGNDETITNDTEIQVDARNNYWGEGVDPKLSVSGNVLIAPWYTDGEMSDFGPSTALSYLLIEGGELEQEFDYAQLQYSVLVEHDQESIWLIAETFTNSSTIMVNGHVIDKDKPYEISVPEGNTQITIQVVDENHASQEYSLSVIRETGPKVYIVNSFNDTLDFHPGDGECLDVYGECTLRAAIMEANATEAHDKIILPKGEIVLNRAGQGEDEARSGDLDILNPLTIEGAGAELTTINGSGIDRVFDVQTDKFIISNLTITGGYATDGVGGAAIYSSASNYIHPDDCHYYYCDSNPPEVDDYNFMIRDVVIKDHVSDDGSTYSETLSGAIENYGAMLLERVVIENNYTIKQGGGLKNWGYAKLVDSSVRDNTAEADGGGIFNANDAYLIVQDTDIVSNAAYNDGGGIYNIGYAWIHNSKMNSNTANRFAGVLSGSYTHISSTQISHNEAEWLGGGAAVKDNGILEIYESSIIENSSAGRGGAFAMTDGGWKLLVKDSVVEGNMATNGASLILVDDAVDPYSLIEITESQILNHTGTQIIHREVPDLRLWFSHNYWGENGPYVEDEEWLLLYPYYKDSTLKELVGAPNTLGDLIVDGGKLSPTFVADQEIYGILVEYDVEAISITPYLTHEEAQMMWFEGDFHEGQNAELIEHGEPLEIDLVGAHGSVVYGIAVAGPNEAYPTKFYIINILKEQKIEVNTFEDTIDGQCVDGTGDCSLRLALMHANEYGTSAAILLQEGEYKLTRTGEDMGTDVDISIGDLDVRMPVRIIGAGSADTIIDATSLEDRVFDVEGVPFHVSGVTIRGGSTDESGGAIKFDGCYNCDEEEPGAGAIESSLVDVIITENSAMVLGGAIMVGGHNLYLRDVEIRDNTSGYSGGGIYVDYHASLTAERTKFISNTAEYEGGAVYNDSDMVKTVIKDSFFEGNRTSSNQYWFDSIGGAIANTGRMDISGTTFLENASLTGGAIFNGRTADLRIMSSIFYKNSAHLDGGAVFNWGMLTAQESSIFEENEGRHGGAVANIGRMLMQDSSLTSNQAREHGGGILNGNQLILRDSRLIGNEAGLNGGGIHAEVLLEYGESTDMDDKVDTRLTGVDLANNSAGMDGGGMYTYGFADVLNSTIRGNHAAEFGGGLHLYGESHVVNSTFAYNQAGSNGAGIYAAGPWLTLTHSTISANIVTEPVGGQVPQSGGLATEAETTEIVNSILYDNTVIHEDIGWMVDCVGSFYPLGVNIIGGEGCQVLEDEEAEENGIVLDVDPLLGELTDHGGKVMTMALLPGSPAIDGGRDIPLVSEDMAWAYNPEFDARGVERPQSTARDIGAYEVFMDRLSFLALYDSDRAELLIRFGSELDMDTPLNPELFEVSASDPHQNIPLGIESVRYGEDGRSIILKLEAPQLLEGTHMSLFIATSAVRFADPIYVFRTEANVLTQWELQATLLEIFAHEIENAKDIDIGIIVRALAEGTLADLFGDSYYDPAIVRFLLSLIETKYVGTVNPIP